MVSNKEKSEEYKFNNSKKNFEESCIISEYNKKLVDRYIVAATNNRKNRTNIPYSYNSIRYNILKKTLETIWKNKKLDEIDYRDVEDLAHSLETDKLQNESNNGSKPYAMGYKQQFCKIINSFFTYHYGRDKSKADNIILNDFGKKILNIVPPKFTEKPILTYSDINNILQKTKKLKIAYYFAVLFSGGFRIEEFLNIRFKDIREEEGEKQNYYVFHITQGTKTGKPRRVEMYSYIKIIKDYLEELKQEKDYNEENYVFKGSPQSCNKLIKKTLKEILEYSDEKSKLYHNHSMRRSAATYYALNVSEREADIYERFGWAFGSEEAKEYIMMSHSSQGRGEKLYRKANIYEETKQNEKKLEFQSKEINNLKQSNNDTLNLIENLKNELNIIKQKQEITESIYKNVTNKNPLGDKINILNSNLSKNVSELTSQIHSTLDDPSHFKILSKEEREEQDKNTTSSIKLDVEPGSELYNLMVKKFIDKK